MPKLTTVPFNGFYETLHSNAFDSIIEYEAEALTDYSDNEEMIDDYIERYNRAIDYRKAYEAYAKLYVERYSEAIGAALKFESLKSPKYYNYETDTIYAYIKVKDVQALYKDICKVRLNKLIADKFTSYDGFISFYPNTLDAWGKLSTWDHNQIGTLLECIQPDSWEVMEDCGGNGEIENIMWQSMNDDDVTLLNNLRECIENDDKQAYDEYCAAYSYAKHVRAAFNTSAYSSICLTFHNAPC